MEEPPAGIFDSNFLILLLAASLCIVLSLLFSASESAFLGLNKLRIHFLREKGDKKAVRVSKLLERKEELLNMLLVGNELVNVTLSVILTSLALKLFGAAGLAYATGTATILLLLFGEITPKCVTTRYPEESAFALSPFVKFFFWLLRPLVIFFTGISRTILKVFGIDTKKKKVTFTEDEIKTFIDVGSEEGILNTGEQRMMNRVFKFSDLNAEDIMIPRRSIIAVPQTISYRELVELSERTRLSQFPVFHKDIDDIIGVLYVKDLLKFSGEKHSFKAGNFVRPPIFIPSTTKMTSIQSLLTENKQSFAIVIDEYSGTDGILTSDDIAEEIFGSLAYETENFSRPQKNQTLNPQNIYLNGDSRLDEVKELLHIPIEDSQAETLAGWLLEKLGYIPGPGDSYEEGGWVFVVTLMEGLRISKVHCLWCEATGEVYKEDA